MGKIKFYKDVTKYGLPFILIKEGKFKGVIMLIDTGSNDNIIWGYAYEQLKDRFAPVEGNSSLYGLEGKVTEVKKVSCTMSFCGKEHDMVFLLGEDDGCAVRLAKDMGFPMAGIIGTNFMAEHNWTIDYAKQEIRIPEGDVSTSLFAAIRKRLK